MIDLTVVIATFTRTDLLRELLDGLLLQTVPIEIIVSDDGSNPFSIAEVHRGVVRYIWAARDGGYHRVLRFNEGVALARTEYVVLLDDDCLPIFPEWAASHLKALKDSQVVRGVFLNDKSYALPPWFSSTNVSMHTPMARDMGPFDPNYDGRYGWEDHDMGREIEKRGLTVETGGPATAVGHRGIIRHEYHTGLQENETYYVTKWKL